MAYSNGRLPRSALAPITRAANGQQAYLRKDAAAAFMAMNAESVRRFGVTLRVSSARTAYRPIADQQYFWGLYVSGRGNLAARPGTSNHGWGLAIDLATPQMRAIVDKIGAKYGWAKRWSDAPSEWWHIKWRSGVWKKPAASKYPTIRKGSKRLEAIKRLQRLLRHKGFKSVAVTGHYNLLTRRAVRRFQKKHHLHIDGVVGPTTWKKLRS
jgi:hypothetical protein